MSGDEQQQVFRDVLRGLPTWDNGLAPFDTGDVPDVPVVLFQRWFVEAVGAGVVEPHAMALATVDGGGRPDVRTLLLHDADERGWHFASHATSAKGRQLAVSPWAALGFYWPAQGRQVRARAEPDSPVPTWTAYVLDADEVEFFQGDAQRRHVRLRYRRTDSGWVRELLWP
ncbi:pyridoxamine 5'-phosphate oxidase family protein [Streptomyces niveus]|uniref:pyridoxine 5'-phosphate oxidase C-terminal domain-containing protein n=1 Tax=Streptomyces niveus TaxID=193462 RepID=UPI0003C57639|nr:pyridoxamine 5'-phosphate oxidase family protein [Streptomyces niveus]EST24969.1 hypothetical protein M877_23700 [Streptomyces niveus NCIMB 11891]